MEGLENTLDFIQINWANIIIVVLILLVAGTKVINWLKLSKEQKIASLLVIIKSEVLKLMCEAEIKWEDYKKSGELKKSYVISKIYELYPDLKNFVDQDLLIKELTILIDSTMDKMNKIINNKKE